MNIDKMKEEEKDASESGTGVSEEKNSNESPEAAQADTQGSLSGNAKEAEAQEVAEPVSEPLKPGAQLAAFRVAAGIDQEQVAASLKMTVRQVRELEADNYEALHGVAISRGFIRAYAKMLQVDPDPLVALFKTEEPASRQLDQIPRQNSSERFMQSQSFGKKRGMGKTGWLILVIIVLALIYGAYSMKWFSGGSFSFKKKTEPVAEIKKQDTSKSVSTEIETPKVVMSGQEKSPASEENSPARNEEKTAEGDSVKKEADKSAPAADAADGDADKQNASKSDSSSQPDKQEKTVESQPEKAVEAAPAVPQNFLVMRFSGPSRVQVLKANASPLREFDGKAGDREKLEVNEPVTVVVEKAANVQMAFREQPLVLKTARRSPAAKVELK